MLVTTQILNQRLNELRKEHTKDINMLFGQTHLLVQVTIALGKKLDKLEKAKE